MTLLISPVQLCLSPVYPGLHVQLYEPWLLTQLALAWHLCEAEVHSSTSEKINGQQRNICPYLLFYADSICQLQTAFGSIWLKDLIRRRFLFILFNFQFLARVFSNYAKR